MQRHVLISLRLFISMVVAMILSILSLNIGLLPQVTQDVDAQTKPTSAQNTESVFDPNFTLGNLSSVVESSRTISNSLQQPGDKQPLELRTSGFISGSLQGTLGVRGFENIFYATDDLKVQANQVLTISEGTWIVFPPNTRMDIKGKLIAAGNPVFPIYFSNLNEAGWEGLHFHSSGDESLCNGCRIEGISSGNAALEVNTPITFKEGVIQGVPNGTAISSTVPFTVSNMVIDSVGTGVYISDKNTISQTLSHLTITRCDQGVMNQGQNVVLKNSIVVSCSTAVSTAVSGTTTVLYSLFDDNGQNFSTETGSQLELGSGILYASPRFVDFPKRFRLHSDSPAVDSADPASDYSREWGYNGDRANMGAYGNTIEATDIPPDDSQLFASFDKLVDTGEPGQTVTYTLTITHMGSTYDSYFLKATVSNGRELNGCEFKLQGLNYTYDTAQYSKYFFEMQPGEQRQLEIGVKIPPIYVLYGTSNTTFIDISGGHGAPPKDFELITVIE